MIRRKELNEVHFLRGLASLLVCLFHLVCGNGLFPSKNFLKDIFASGFLGVEIFFILSGYVISYAFPSSFELKDYRTFFLKRVVRIEPPYIISIILVLVLNTISYKITNTENNIDWLNILGHLAYANNFGFGKYVNVVYWTLGIEFQFYLLIALLFPFIRKSLLLLSLALLSFLLLSCIKMPSGMMLITPYLSYFGLGITAFFYKTQKQTNLGLLVLMATCFLSQILIFQGLSGCLAALFALLILLTWKYINRTILFFSMISYSLYLTHVPVGGKVINLGLRYIHSDLGRYILLSVALLISITFAYAFCVLIEKPFMKMSKRILYKKELSAPAKRQNTLAASPVMNHTERTL